MSPLALREWDDAYPVVVAVSLAAFLLLITYALPRLCRVGTSDLFLPILGVIVGLTYVQNFRWGTVSIPIALLVTLTWNRVRRRRSTGVALGVASTLKLYPGAMAIPLLFNRVTRKSGVVSAVTFALLNIGGAAITGVSVAVSVRMIQTGGSTWLAHPGNVSLPGVVSRIGLPLWVSYVVVAAGVAVLVAVCLKRPINQSIALSLVLAVVISPLSWPHYDVLVLPVLMVLWCMRVDWKWAGPVVLMWTLINVAAQARNLLFDFEYFNLLILVARLGLVAAVVAVPVTLWTESDVAAEPIPENL
jgi:alpha-1,2-mannosyltransferase